jgi:hypothetical protein
MLDKDMITYLLKYIVLGLAVFLLAKYLFGEKLVQYDLIIISVVIVLISILFEKVFCKPTEINKEVCSAYCAKPIEKMTDVSGNPSLAMPKAEMSQEEMIDESIKQQTADIMKQVEEKRDAEIKGLYSKTETVVSKDFDSKQAQIPNTEEIVNKIEPKLAAKEEAPRSDYPEVVMQEEDCYSGYFKTEEEKKACIERGKLRREVDVAIDDMPYTDYNHLPLAETYEKGDFEYGYSFLPPEKWYPTPPFPPMCVSEKRCPVNPTYTTGVGLDLKEWKQSCRVSQPDNINTCYVRDKLNAGR